MTTQLLTTFPLVLIALVPAGCRPSADVHEATHRAGVVTVTTAPAVAPAIVTESNVSAVAKVNGQTKKLFGHTYHLSAIRYDPLVMLRIGGNSGTVWIVNSGGNEMLVDAQGEEMLPGKLDLGIRLAWMKLPDKGNLEVLFGLVYSETPESPAQYRKQLLEAGCKPFTIDVTMLPEVKAETAESLSEQMLKIGLKK